MARIDPEVELTPLENLVVEVLVARYRLGEPSWSFDNSVTKTLNALAKKGYVKQLPHRPGNPVSASLTDEAIALNLSHDYVPTIAANNPELTEAFKAITENARGIKARLNKKSRAKLQIAS